MRIHPHESMHIHPPFIGAAAPQDYGPRQASYSQRVSWLTVRYELGEYDMTVRVLEKLVNPKTKGRAAGEQTGPPPDVESKWVDLLIKSYVKVGRVGDAVSLTDEQLARIDSAKEPFVHARVALTVFPWRYGAAVWKDVKSHYKQLVRASELSLQLSPKEVEGTFYFRWCARSAACAC